MVTILMAYASGIPEMLNVAHSAIKRHNAGCEYDLRVIIDDKDDKAAEEASFLSPIPYNTGKVAGSGQHARMLDEAMKDVDSDFVLTMDSDCFPVSDGWLGCLVSMLSNEGVGAAGILWPWAPPNDSIDHGSIEWRVRSQHCWLNTQVSCQLLNVDLVKGLRLKFADPESDDTNFGMISKLKSFGFKIDGWMPTRCPIPDIDCDPELNRFESMIFGDKVYHHVGATREKRGEIRGGENMFASARRRVYEELGAEWMLNDGESYRYKFDKEEEVAAHKMRIMYRSAVWFLEKNSSLFGGGWAKGD